MFRLYIYTLGPRLCSEMISVDCLLLKSKFLESKSSRVKEDMSGPGTKATRHIDPAWALPAPGTHFGWCSRSYFQVTVWWAASWLILKLVEKNLGQVGFVGPSSHVPMRKVYSNNIIIIWTKFQCSFATSAHWTNTKVLMFPTLSSYWGSRVWPGLGIQWISKFTPTKPDETRFPPPSPVFSKSTRPNPTPPSDASSERRSVRSE